MNDLEKYIRDHAAEFDTAEPAGGHEARFLARLEASQACLSPAGGRKLFFGSRKTNFRSALRNAFARQAWVPAFALACVAALLVLIIRPGDPLHGISRSPEAIYVAYMDQVADLYRDLPMQDDTLREITDEAESLFEQMPEGLSDRQRSRILKDHYGELLAAARQLKKIQ